MNNTKEILDDMRKITMLTGEISSVHEKSLKTWPYVVFDNLEGLEVDYDLSKDTTQTIGEGHVTFKMTAPEIELDDFKKQGEFGKRCDILTSWVRDMFWPEIKVAMYLNGKEYYTNSNLKLEANPKNSKEEKSWREEIQEMKDGPKQD